MLCRNLFGNFPLLYDFPLFPPILYALSLRTYKKMVKYLLIFAKIHHTFRKEYTTGKSGGGIHIDFLPEYTVLHYQCNFYIILPHKLPQDRWAVFSFTFYGWVNDWLRLAKSLNGRQFEFWPNFNAMLSFWHSLGGRGEIIVILFLYCIVSIRVRFYDFLRI